MYRTYARDISKILSIGHAGENESRCVIFDISDFKSEFGEGIWSIVFSRDNVEDPYLVTNTYELEDKAVWVLSSTDTAIKGRGRVELRYMVDDVVVKTDLYTTELLPSLGDTGVAPPTPSEDLLNKIAEIVADVKSDAKESTSSAAIATDAAKAAESSEIAAQAKAQEAATNARQAKESELKAAEYKDLALSGTPEGYEDVAKRSYEALYVDDDGMFYTLMEA